MVEESARVLRVEGEVVWVEAIRQSACESCSAQKGCGHGLMSKYSLKSVELSIDRCGFDVYPNDQIMIGIDESALLKSSLLIYGIPLAAMIAIAIISQAASFSEGLTVILSFIGMLAGFAIVSSIVKRNGLAALNPSIVSVIKGEPSRIPVCHL